MQEGAVERLEAILRPHCGGLCPVQIQYERPDAKAKLNLGRKWCVTPSDELLEELEDAFCKESVELVY